MYARRSRLAVMLLAILFATGTALAQKGSTQAQPTTQPGIAGQEPLPKQSGAESEKQNREANIPSAQSPVKAPNEQDKRFLKAAAIGDEAEIQLGQLAEQKASDNKVRQFGARLVKDHSNNDDLLKGVAQSQRVALPTELDPEHQDLKARLEKLSGTQFDKAFVREMVQEHKKTIAKFQHEAATSTDPTVKGFAQQSVPVLQSHLTEAKRLNQELNGAK